MLRTNARRRTRRAPASVRAAGFTLIEIMVVVMILGLLSSLVAVNVWRHAHEARCQAAAADCRTIAEAAKLFLVERGRAPTLEDLTRRENGRSYLDEVHGDPWGTPYELRVAVAEGVVEVCSAGENRAMGDDDDITSAAAPPR